MIDLARIFLTRAEAAEILAVSPSWLKKGNGPRATKLGPRTIRYHRADVEAYAEAQRGGECSTAAEKSGGRSSSAAALSTASRRERQIVERLRLKRHGSKSKPRATLIVVSDAEQSRP